MFSYEEIQKYSETDIRIYKYIVSNIDKIQYMTIRELANEVQVSTSTILRFCNKNSFEGYSEFKDALKKEITLLQKYNALAYEETDLKNSILKELFGEIGTKVSVASPFICDYGLNIYIGNNVSINMNCTFVDCNRITIGDDVLIASNVQLYTAAHPIEFAERYVENPETGQLHRQTYSLPIKIGNGCWLGGGVIVLPGVTIGDGSVIGAGSVVTKDIPQNSLAVGNPCHAIRKINVEEQCCLK